jgi:hypothetical protein
MALNPIEAPLRKLMGPGSGADFAGHRPYGSGLF